MLIRNVFTIKEFLHKKPTKFLKILISLNFDWISNRRPFSVFKFLDQFTCLDGFQIPRESLEVFVKFAHSMSQLFVKRSMHVHILWASQSLVHSLVLLWIFGYLLPSRFYHCEMVQPVCIYRLCSAPQTSKHTQEAIILAGPQDMK